MSIRQQLAEQYESLLLADGFDDAIIGVDEQSMRVVYSVDKCIEVLTHDHGMAEEEAWEYFSYNVQGAYVGEQTPIFCSLLK